MLTFSLFACNSIITQTEESSDSNQKVENTTEKLDSLTDENSTDKQSGETVTEKTEVLTEEIEDTTVKIEVTTEEIKDNREKIDLFLFIGQSNMAGRGNSSEAVKVSKGHAYEYRAISKPGRLFRLSEPFGSTENNAASGVSEAIKTGSLVSAFCESYYNETEVPIVAVSCSKGGTAISFWDTDGAPYQDAVERMKSAINFMESQSGMKIRHTYVVWLQGESDGDIATPANDYVAALTRIFDGFEQEFGAEHFFIIPIGAYNGNDDARNANYTAIRNAQIDFCNKRNNATVVSIVLHDLLDAGFMKDEFHFTQAGYNIVGSDAGKNTAYFVNTGTEAKCQNYVK